MTRGKLPLGIQNFEELRKGGYLYADKTDMVWQIANGDKYNFLSRPRRFGKSLLVSTLQCYFEGRKELFEGLKIMDLEKDWIKRPVIHFSMNLGGSDAESLYHYLDDTLTKYEEIYGKRNTEATLSNRFTGIIERAYRQSGVQIAVLVDEYDAPLQHSYLTERHDKCRNLYRDFFTGLKDYGYCIKCVFLTGITKFTQISLFSVLNTLSNISFYNSYATICGLTKEEILDNLKDELQALAAQKKWDVGQTMHELKDMYDGYHFSESMQGVYNPYSVICALKEKRLKDNPKLFLYQSGYLTIKGVMGESYRLGFPNREVKKALLELVVPNMLNANKEETENAIQGLKQHFMLGNLEEGVICLKQLVAGTPYSTQKKEQFVFEEHFRFIIKNLFYICGFNVEEEKQVAGGRIDLTIETPEILYIMELKMADNGGTKAAVNQIESRHYADAYAASSKKLVCLALIFDKENRGLTDWQDVE